ncbi:HAD-IA family hydrolase [Frondihabitans cladoniiphilus]|uniref:HAD family hydrolase n=1 Tax=Frondihabitans cladoniiphilus TaxID=715785 RepID=A0ABP8VTP4_9MICO
MTSSRPIDGTVFEAVLFDMDGTLVASTPAVNRSWARWGREQGLPENFRDTVGHGKPAGEIAAELLPADRVDEGAARIQAIEIEEIHDVTMLPGANEALDAVPGERKAIVTSCSTPLAEARMEAAGVHRPATIVTASDIVHGKPDPEPFLLGATRLGVDPTRVLVVEDAPAGLQSGRAAGMTTLAVVGTHEANELEADLVIDTLELVRFVPVDGGVRVEIVEKGTPRPARA